MGNIFHQTQKQPKKSGSSLPLQPIFQNRIFQNYFNCIEKGQKEHTKCYMISNPTSKFAHHVGQLSQLLYKKLKNKNTPKFTSQIRSIQSVFGRNRTGTGSEKIDQIDRNRISGRTLDPSKGVPAVKTEWKDSSEGVRDEGSEYCRDPSKIIQAEGYKQRDTSGGI